VIVESVTKKTDYLVDEEGKQSSKRKKAEELGITIISDLTTFI
jgi:NAD-dependent DNA ligase